MSGKRRLILPISFTNSRASFPTRNASDLRIRCDALLFQYRRILRRGSPARRKSISDDSLKSQLVPFLNDLPGVHWSSAGFLKGGKFSRDVHSRRRNRPHAQRPPKIADLRITSCASLPIYQLSTLNYELPLESLAPGERENAR